MGKRIKEIFQTNKMMRIGLLAVAALVLVLLGLALAVSLRGKWIKGGADTKGPFRYCIRNSGKIDVRIQTSDLPKGSLYVMTPDEETIQTVDQGETGKEHRYRINAEDTSYADWSVKLYADKEAKEKDEALYWLTISIDRDENGKLEVSSAQANDEHAVVHVQNQSYDYQYQIQDIDAAVVNLQINAPLEENWYMDYDKKLLRATDFFYGEDAIWDDISCAIEESFETDITVYTQNNTDNAEEKDLQFQLHVKGENGSITEVTHE